jgi:hypothetical protein
VPAFHRRQSPLSGVVSPDASDPGRLTAEPLRPALTNRFVTRQLELMHTTAYPADPERA